MKIWSWAGIAMVGCMAALSASARANVPLRFVAAQEQASFVILAVAHPTEEGTLRLEVKRTYAGVNVGPEILLRAPRALRGSEVTGGQTYLILLGADREPFAEYRIGDLPLLGCGIINIIAVRDGVILDPGLYDTKYLNGSTTLKLSTIENELTRTKGQKGG